MLFPTHLVVAVGLGRGRLPTAWIVAGAALPDLVDKPLAMVGVIPTYHSVVHSALFGFGFVVPLLVARWRGGALTTGRVTAVLVGWGSHIAADAAHITINGRPANTVFLLWPIVDEWDSIDAGPIPFAVQYLGTTSFYVELVIWVSVGLLIFRNGVPSPDLDL
ncbi:MAG: zinc dependent phospholipase C family protein [Salinirussus sp.]